jgi:uncharacterized membrane protein YfcA
MEIGIYLAIGAIAGIVAGLFGVGGGLLIVPVLVMVFTAHEMAPAVITHLAIGTSLAAIVPTSIASMVAHHRHGAVEWPAFARLAPGLVIGALIGSVIADFLPSATLKRIFGVFELAVAAQIAFGHNPAPHRRLPGAVGMGTAGTVIGIVSAIIGIGGGTLTVPFLVWCNVALKRAIATSAACGLPIAIAGAVGFAIAGRDAAELPPAAFGYIYGPALVGVGVASVLAAPFGAQLAHRLPTHLLRRFFSIFLALLGIRMLI